MNIYPNGSAAAQLSDSVGFESRLFLFKNLNDN